MNTFYRIAFVLYIFDLFDMCTIYYIICAHTFHYLSVLCSAVFEDLFDLQILLLFLYLLVLNQHQPNLISHFMPAFFRIRIFLLELEYSTCISISLFNLFDMYLAHYMDTIECTYYKKRLFGSLSAQWVRHGFDPSLILSWLLN